MVLSKKPPKVLALDIALQSFTLHVLVFFFLFHKPFPQDTSRHSLMSSSHRKPEKPALQAHTKPLILSVHEPMRKNNNFISSAKKFNSTELQGLRIFQVVRKILFWFLARRNTLSAIIKIRDTSRWVWRGDKSVSQNSSYRRQFNVLPNCWSLMYWDFPVPKIHS